MEAEKLRLLEMVEKMEKEKGGVKKSLEVEGVEPGGQQPLTYSVEDVEVKAKDVVLEKVMTQAQGESAEENLDGGETEDSTEDLTIVGLEGKSRNIGEKWQARMMEVERRQHDKFHKMKKKQMKGIRLSHGEQLEDEETETSPKMENERRKEAVARRKERESRGRRVTITGAKSEMDKIGKTIAPTIAEPEEKVGKIEKIHEANATEIDATLSPLEPAPYTEVTVPPKVDTGGLQSEVLVHPTQCKDNKVEDLEKVNLEYNREEKKQELAEKKTEVVAESKFAQSKIPRPKIPRLEVPGPKVVGPKAVRRKVVGPEVARQRVAGPEVPGQNVGEPEVAGPKIAKPEVAGPKVAGPDVPGRKVAEPEIAGVNGAGPEVAGPKVVGPDVPGRKVAEPEIAGVNGAGPEVAGPKVTRADVPGRMVTEPEIARVNGAGPEVAGPKVAEPEVAEPEVVEPEVVEPEVAEPEVVEPEVAEPEVVWTEVATSTVAGPQFNEEEKAYHDQQGIFDVCDMQREQEFEQLRKQPFHSVPTRAPSVLQSTIRRRETEEEIRRKKLELRRDIEAKKRVREIKEISPVPPFDDGWHEGSTENLTGSRVPPRRLDFERSLPSQPWLMDTGTMGRSSMDDNELKPMNIFPNPSENYTLCTEDMEQPNMSSPAKARLRRPLWQTRQTTATDSLNRRATILGTRGEIYSGRTYRTDWEMMQEERQKLSNERFLATREAEERNMRRGKKDRVNRRVTIIGAGSEMRQLNDLMNSEDKGVRIKTEKLEFIPLYSHTKLEYKEIQPEPPSYSDIILTRYLQENRGPRQRHGNDLIHPAQERASLSNTYHGDDVPWEYNLENGHWRSEDATNNNMSASPLLVTMGTGRWYPESVQSDTLRRSRPAAVEIGQRSRSQETDTNLIGQSPSPRPRSVGGHKHDLLPGDQSSRSFIGGSDTVRRSTPAAVETFQGRRSGFQPSAKNSVNQSPTLNLLPIHPSLATRTPTDAPKTDESQSETKKKRITSEVLMTMRSVGKHEDPKSIEDKDIVMAMESAAKMSPPEGHGRDALRDASPLGSHGNSVVRMPPEMPLEYGGEKYQNQRQLDDHVERVYREHIEKLKSQQGEKLGQGEKRWGGETEHQAMHVADHDPEGEGRQSFVFFR